MLAVEQGLLLIPLRSRNGEFRWAKVDVDDAPIVTPHKWFFDGMYAATKSGKHNLRLHRLLVGKSMACRSVEVDHINLDKLDNRRSNLRLVPHSVNSRNVPSQGGSSQFRGVTWDKKRETWRAQANHSGKGYHLGYFDDEQEAAAAAIAFWRHVEEVAV
jgi:hypothetical protein